MYYLIEPYNAWQKTPKKKHWMEIAEEEALFHRIMAEAQAAQQQVQNASPAAAAGAAGAGGQAPYQYYNPQLFSVFFTATPTAGGAPLSVSFQSSIGGNVPAQSYLWDFGDGTTSTETNPIHIYQTGSNATGYTVLLQSTNSYGHAANYTRLEYISASIPVVSASFTGTPLTGVSDLSVSFNNTTTNTGTGTMTYKWLFTSASSPTASSATNPSAVFYTGSHTIKLEATGAYYNIMNSMTKINYISASLPVIDADFTSSIQRGTAPLNVTFSNLTTYTGVPSTVTYRWTLGSGSAGTQASTATSPTCSYTVTGSYTIKLEATGAYNVQTSSRIIGYISCSL